MRKSYLWVMAVIGMAIALAGCSKDDNGLDEKKHTEEVEIMASSKALSLEVSTKAPFTGAVGTGNTLAARVFVSKTSGNYGTLHTDGTMTFGSDATDATNPVPFGSVTAGNKFFPGNDDIYLVGLHPVTSTAISSGAVSYTIDGKSDVMYAGEKSTSKGATPAPALVFNHLLTKLNIFVQTENANESTAAAWGNIIGLTLTAKNTVAVALADGTPDFGTNTGSISFYKGVTDNAVSSANVLAVTAEVASSPIAYSMVPPVTLTETTDAQSAYTLSLKTTTSGTNAISVPITVTTDGSITNSTGYSFDITLTFKGTEITATATVTAWQDGGTGAGTIQ